MHTSSGTRILLGYNQFLCAEALAAGEPFSLSLFEDLNKLIESVVLYDKIVLLGQYSLPSGILATPLEKEGVIKTISNDELQNLISRPGFGTRFSERMRDAFGEEAADTDATSPEKLLRLRISPNMLDQFSYNKLFGETIACNTKNGFKREYFTRWISRNIYQTRDRGGHFYYLARAVLYVTLAEEAEMDYAPDLLRLPLAALSFSKETKALPKALYDALSEKVHSEVEALALLGMPVAVFVPPLTAKLLSRTDSPRNYPQELLELRGKFSGFRAAYAEFLAVLKDPSLTLQQKIDAKANMISRITGIIEQGESRHALNVKTIWDKVVNASLDGEGSSAKISLSGMVSILIDMLAKETAKGQARALFDLWTDTLNLKNYGHLVQKAFKTEIDPAEVEQYKNYSEAIRGLIMSAGLPRQVLESPGNRR